MKAQVRTTFHIVPLIALVASLLGSALTYTPAHAASITVNSTGDSVAVDGFCTLREAIQAAETNAAVNECAAGSGVEHDYITFSAPSVITLGSSLSTSTNLHITGWGSDLTVIQASACDPTPEPPGCTTASYPVLTISGGSLSLASLTMQYGVGTNGGGIVKSGGSLLISGSKIVRNVATGAGGGIWNQVGSLSVIQTSVMQNRAQGIYGGGGLYNEAGMTIDSSTFSDNEASYGTGQGGGITNYGTGSVYNSTFGANVAHYGGGLSNFNSVAVLNSTFYSNAANTGGGIYNALTLSLYNTMLAGSLFAEDCYNDPGSTLTANTSNLIDTNGPSGHECDTPNVGSSPGSLVLGDYGGPTQTFAIGITSTAMNAGDTTVCSGAPMWGFDQRGAPRRTGGCDIGSFEFHTQPINDNIGVAASIPGLRYNYGPGDTAGAGSGTIFDPDPNLPFGCITGSNQQGYNSVWFDYTPPSNVLVTIDTLGSNYNTVLAVWTGSSGSLTAVACNDNIGGPISLTQSRVRIPLSGGTTYHIEALSRSFGGGNLYLHASTKGTAADFNGNGVSDIKIFRSGAWLNYDFVTGLAAGSVWTGNPGGACIPAPMDYDGDGTLNFTQLCSGAWNFYNDSGGFVKGIWLGNIAGLRPVPADYDGDGKDDVVVFNAGAWNKYNFTTGAYMGGVWTGNPGGNGIPVPMDYNGDGSADPTILSGGAWHFYNDGGPYNKGIWVGNVAGQLPVAGDYNGDGTDDVRIFRGGAWLAYDFATGAYLPGSSVWTGAPPPPAGGGATKPAPLDYDGDGALDLSVFAGGPWHFYNDNGSYNKGIWVGRNTADLAISRRQLP